jgi:hypothetical protein
MLLRPPSQHFLDSYAIRHLVRGRPAALVPLSAVQLGPARFMQRCRVTSPSGEEAVLMFDMRLTVGQPPAARWGPMHVQASAGQSWAELAALRGVWCMGSMWRMVCVLAIVLPWSQQPCAA